MEELVKDMKPRLIEDLGRRYPTEKSKHKARYGIFECQYCGNHWEVITTHINTGHTKSCGCVNLRITHGLTYHNFYGTWACMVKRCSKPKREDYKYYGARGITVCEEWLDVSNFVAWCDITFPNIEGYTLDRIDVNKGYSPENCRWADASTQVINQRMRRTNTSGYVGINWVESKLKWVSKISVAKKTIWLGEYKTIEEAVQARDNYIIENKLPHKLSTEYEGFKYE